MKKIVFAFTFYVGIDLLGFPQYITHKIFERVIINSNYFRGYSKK